jgi:hypothetical protein
MPMLINGISTSTQSLYLISLLLPSGFLTLASYLLRYKPLPPRRAPKSSTAGSTVTHLSLALQTTSQLSLPISISPKLTPPNPRDIDRPNSAPPTRMSNLLEPKPSVSNFGYVRYNVRPHTVYGAPVSGIGNEVEDGKARRVLARRSGDVWVENGHALLGGGLMSRAKEMVKPVPALRVLDHHVEPTRPRSMVFERLKGGVNSLLNRQSMVVGDEGEEREMEVRSPIAISITSPSKFERGGNENGYSRNSGVSLVSGEEEGEGEWTENGESMMPSAEIVMAKRGRMSSSPAFVFRPESTGTVRMEEGYEVDWLTAGVLPG